MDFIPRSIFLAPKTKIDQEKDTPPSLDRKEFWNRTYPRIPVLVDEIKKTDDLMQKIKTRNAELSAELRILRTKKSKILLRKLEIIKYRDRWFERISIDPQVQRMMTSVYTDC
ncbi:uncharacterized protein LOC130667945 [Microplitis mediator]|uniref:uncharacterized protein LOC130667945 n=1 Tax=Microplitis mediator TaxID=375433 RepID=UPI00255795F4|nr:uncharacterized protein LOC130667945 [Microplitis mediator]